MTELEKRNEKIRALSLRFKDVSNIFLSAGVIYPIVGILLNFNRVKITETIVNSLVLFAFSVSLSIIFTYFELKLLERLK